MAMQHSFAVAAPIIAIDIFDSPHIANPQVSGLIVMPLKSKSGILRGRERKFFLSFF